MKDGRLGPGDSDPRTKEDGKVGVYVPLGGDVLGPTRFRVRFKGPGEKIQVKIPVWETLDGRSVHAATLIAFPRQYKDSRGWVYIVEDFGFGKVAEEPEGQWHWSCTHSMALYRPTKQELELGYWAEPPKPKDALPREEMAGGKVSR